MNDLRKGSSWKLHDFENLDSAHVVATITDIGIWAICPGSIYSMWSHNRNCISELILSGSSFQRSLPNISWKFVNPAAVLIWRKIPIPMWNFTNWWLEQLQKKREGGLVLKKGARRLRNMDEKRNIIIEGSTSTAQPLVCSSCIIQRGLGVIVKEREREKEPQKSYHVRFWKFWKTV